METIFLPQYKLTFEEKKEIARLLGFSFPEFPLNRHFYRQLPHFYWILKNDGTSTKIEGIVGAIHRNIKINDKILPIFGLMDICIHPDFQKQGWATQLLQTVENFAIRYQIPMLMLFADNPRLYLNNGFSSLRAVVRWQMIDELKQISLNIDEKELDNMMIKILDPTLKLAKKNVKVDLLGWIF